MNRLNDNGGTAVPGLGRRGMRCGFACRALLTLLCVLAPGLAFAQAPQGNKMQFTNKQQFRLKIDLPEADRAKLKEVQLYVKAGNADWACKEFAPPNQTHFNFRAPQDGEYWFTIVTVDKAGNATPREVAKEPPAFVVVVDTQSPDVSVSGPGVINRMPVEDAIRCSVKDNNPDPSTIKFEYQVVDKSWRPLEPLANQPELFRCPDRVQWTGQVRVSATDLAKNVTVKELAVSAQPQQTSAPPTAMAPPSGAPAAHPLPAEPIQRADYRTEKVTGPEPVHVQHLQPQPMPAQLTPRDMPGNRIVVRQLHAALDYRIDQVGPSGVGLVEVWLTGDEGRTWQRLCEDADRRSPAEFDLPREGTYGVAIVVANGNHVGNPPPAAGTAPDCWIEVDSTRPTGQILGVRPGGSDNPWSMMITYAASDRNLGHDPIDLYYSTQKSGPWFPIARGLKNEGNYIWNAPKDAGFQFYVRLDVTDRAGNMTRCDMPEAVVLDMQKPRATVIGVSASGPSMAPPSGN